MPIIYSIKNSFLVGVKFQTYYMEETHRMKIDRFKKGKGPFLYTTESQKYYDLRQNSNILGHSLKSITTEVKNFLSSCWNLHGIETTAHYRLEKELNRIFPDNYSIRASSSIEEFLARLFLNFSGEKQIIGEGFKDWLKERRIPYNSAIKGKRTLSIHDMADYYLSGRTSPPVNSEFSLNLLNYYWYPEQAIEFDNSADAVILPEIYCGNFKFIIILVKKDCKELLEASDNLESIQSLQVNSALKQYYTIKKAKKGVYPEEVREELEIKGRIITFKGPVDRTKADEITARYAKRGLLLNSEAPYYSYLPQNLTENQYNFIKRGLT